MSKISKNKIYEKIKSILKIRISNIHIFWCISIIYMFLVLIWVMIYNPYELRNSFELRISLHNLKYFSKNDLILIIFSYLPLIVMYLFDFIVNKSELINKIAKVIRILLIVLGYIYFVIYGFLNVVGISFALSYYS